MEKHTPGPWSILDGAVYGAGHRICAIQTYFHGSKATQDKQYNEVKANARLISAAPDLVAALERLDLRCTTDYLNPCWDGRPGDVAGKHYAMGDACSACNARAALAKAKG